MEVIKLIPTKGGEKEAIRSCPYFDVTAQQVSSVLNIPRKISGSDKLCPKEESCNVRLLCERFVGLSVTDKWTDKCLMERD